MTRNETRLHVAFSHCLPFYLFHGGSQTMIEALAEALRSLGVTVTYEAWWELEQKAGIIHFFGRPGALHVRMAKERGYKVVFTDMLDSVASRRRTTLWAQKALIAAFKKCLGGFVDRFGWDTYRTVDAYVTIVPHEIRVAQFLFGVCPDICYHIPHGLQADVLQKLAMPKPNGDYLFSHATISPRKNTLELAKLAKKAKTKIVFAGKPYSEQDAYYQAFIKEVDDQYVHYAGFVTEEEKVEWMTGAKGFVLLSEFESGCISVYEAAAAGLPLLLSDKPWAREAYPVADRIEYVDIQAIGEQVDRINAFFMSAKRCPGDQTFPVHDWPSVAMKYVEIYKKLVE